MRAAADRLQAAASNTANRSTEGFARREVIASESPEGGVQTRTVQTQSPNDSDAAVIEDAVEAHQAALTFTANAAVLRAGDTLLGTLLDTFA
jgi:flagellar basal body rod protein FlgG